MASSGKISQTLTRPNSIRLSLQLFLRQCPAHGSVTRIAVIELSAALSAICLSLLVRSSCISLSATSNAHHQHRRHRSTQPRPARFGNANTFALRGASTAVHQLRPPAKRAHHTCPQRLGQRRIKLRTQLFSLLKSSLRILFISQTPSSSPPPCAAADCNPRCRLTLHRRHRLSQQRRNLIRQHLFLIPQHHRHAHRLRQPAQQLLQ